MGRLELVRNQPGQYSGQGHRFDREPEHPAAIGTGWLSPYPLAFGYAWQNRTVRHCFIWCWNDTVPDRCYYVNEGWGGGGAGDWVDASTWFAGQIFP